MFVKRLVKPVSVFLFLILPILPACSSSSAAISDHLAVRVILDYWEAMNDFDAEKALGYLEPVYREAEREDVKGDIARMAPLKFMNFRLTIIEATEPVYIEDNKVKVQATLKTPIGQRYLLYHLVQVDGEWKISRETTDPTKAPPRAPSELVATATSSTQIDLSWSDNSKIEDGYRIERATNNAFTKDWKTFTVGPNVTTYSDTSASPATTYFYSVFAFDPAGDSRPTNTAQVTTP